MGSLAEKVEVTEDGKKVIIPRELWEEIKELAEHVYLYHLISERKDKPAVHTLDELLKDEGLKREDLGN